MKLNKERMDLFENKSENKLIKQIKHYLIKKNQYQNPKLSIDSMAHDLNIDTQQVIQLFDYQMSTSFNDYVLQLRINRAIKLLKDNEFLNSGSIYSTVGFKSNTTFYNAFKKITGKSPSDYR